MHLQPVRGSGLSARLIRRARACSSLVALAQSACAPHAAAPPAGTLAAKSEALHNACAAADWGYARRLVHEAREDWSSIEPTAYQQGASPMLLGMVSAALPQADDAVDRHARRACASNA